MAAVKDDAKATIKQLSKTIESLERQLHEARQARFTIPTGRPRGGGKSKSFCRVVIPDSHGRSIDPAVAKALLYDLEVIQPQEIVWLGDHLDCGGFLSRHQPLYISELDYTFEEDVAAANDFLDKVTAKAPGARNHYLQGNHEHRIDNFIMTASLRNKRDAEYLRKFFSVDVVLGLSKRKFQVYERDGFYDGLKVRGMIKLGKCHFTHGIYTSVNAAKSHLDAYMVNVVYGHTHRMDSFTRRSATSTVSSWCPGALCVQQNYYAHSANSHHTNGYCLQAVQADGSFLNLTIPIINGISFLRPLGAQLGS